ncbi:hypothetical protein D3C71_1410130 [compost metagenome]
MFDRQPREKARFLKYHPSFESRANNLPAIQRDASVEITIQSSDQLEQCGLAAPAPANDAKDFPLTHIERDIPQNFRSVSFGLIGLGDALHGQTAVLQINRRNYCTVSDLIHRKRSLNRRHPPPAGHISFDASDHPVFE